MTDLLLIRHGQTDWNASGRFQGQSDVPLNAHGRAQARRLGERLQGQRLDAIYASDLARTRETGEILAAATGAPLNTDPRLREVDQGLWEGRTLEEILETERQVWIARRDDPLHVAPPGGETVQDLRQRMVQAVESVRGRHPTGRVAIISHGLALAALRVHLLSLPFEQVWDQIPAHTEPMEFTLTPP
jgi:broad specificity phosphatase PhoE